VDISVGIVDAELVQQRHILIGGRKHLILLGQVAARTEVLALAADHQHLHVIVDVRLMHQVGVELAQLRGQYDSHRICSVPAAANRVGPAVAFTLREKRKALDSALGRPSQPDGTCWGQWSH
jgi:hypothetical protein